MLLKLMGPEDCPDHDSRKTFRLLDGVDSLYFRREEGSVFVDVTFLHDPEKETFELEGNCYIMNNEGKTVSSFGIAQL